MPESAQCINLHSLLKEHKQQKDESFNPKHRCLSRTIELHDES